MAEEKIFFQRDLYEKFVRVAHTKINTLSYTKKSIIMRTATPDVFIYAVVVMRCIRIFKSLFS